MRHSLLFLAFFCACSGEPTDDPSETGVEGDADTDADADSDADVDTEPKSACGETTYHDVTVSGRIIGPEGNNAAGVTVWLEERAYLPTVTQYGDGYTDGDGEFSFSTKQIVSVEDCWGVLLDYIVVAERGPLRAEERANTVLFNAITNGTNVANLFTPPIQLEDTAKP